MSINVIYVILSILLFFLFRNLKCKKNSTDIFFSYHEPKNVVFTSKQLLISYNELVYNFMKEKSINVVEFYKVFELLTVHTLINWVIETIEEKEDSKKIKNHVRILNLIDKYTCSFIIDDFFIDEIQISFIHRLIESLRFLHHDNIFLIYKYVENIYNDNIYFHNQIKSQIPFSPSISTLQIDYLKLQFYLDFVKTKNLYFLQYI
jgi:hypothetical protein